MISLFLSRLSRMLMIWQIRLPTIDNIKDEYHPSTGWSEEDFEKKLKERKDDMTYTLRKNCRWIQKGCSEWGAGAIHWGHAEEYLDPSY